MIPMLGHPRAQLVLRFAANELDAVAQARVARHLAACPRCTALVRLARETASAVSTGESPRARAASLESIVRSRAAGARIILPVERTNVASRRSVRPVAVAAGVVLMLGAATWLSLRGGSADARAEAPWGFFLVESASAQATDIASASEPAIRFDALRLRPVRLAYGFRASDGSMLSGGDSLELVATRAQGVDIWELTHTWTMPSQRGTETVTSDRASLRPISRVVRIDPGLAGSQRWYGDSLHSQLNASKGEHRVSTMWTGPGPILASDALGFVALGATKIDAQWTGALAVAGYGWSSDAVFFRATLRVVGAERIRVPAGEFDCWKIQMSLGGLTQYAWVRKSDGVAVRAWRPRQGSLHAMDRVLLSEVTDAR